MAEASKQSKPGSARLNVILALLVMAEFVVVLDFSIVQIALPTIRTELNFPLANLQWVISAYGITFAGFLMFSGRASDIYGRKRLFIVGLAIFALASLACGLAPSAILLIAFRAIQGIGAAFASATGLALVVTIIGVVTQGFALMNSPSALVLGFHYGFVAAAILSARQPRWRCS